MTSISDPPSDAAADASDSHRISTSEKQVIAFLQETLHISSFSNAVKPSAIAGAVIYLGLFLGYRKYYSILGIRPEDVGVTNTFVLARSIGFIMFALFLTVLAVALTSWFYLAFKDARWTRRQALNVAVALVVWAIVSAGFWVLDAPHRELAVLMGALLTIACAAIAQFAHPSRRYLVYGGLALAGLTIIAVPVLAAVISAYIRADLVLAGKESTPVTILGIPLLDVSAEKVSASWICKDTTPVMFRAPHPLGAPVDAILVGETSTSYYLRTGGAAGATSSIVKVPQSCVMLASDQH
jgi:hypothetical protein